MKTTERVSYRVIPNPSYPLPGQPQFIALAVTDDPRWPVAVESAETPEEAREKLKKVVADMRKSGDL